MEQTPELIQAKPASGGAGPTTFVDGYLLYLLAAASEKASAQFHAHIRAEGLRIPEWRVLGSLHDRDAMMITHLAELSLMEQSRMTRIVDHMDDRGLVERVADRSDRRRVRVRLTPAGRALSARLVADARAHEARLLSKLEDTDAALIKPALQTLLARLEAG